MESLHLWRLAHITQNSHKLCSTWSSWFPPDSHCFCPSDIFTLAEEETNQVGLMFGKLPGMSTVTVIQPPPFHCVIRNHSKYMRLLIWYMSLLQRSVCYDCCSQPRRTAENLVSCHHLTITLWDRVSSLARHTLHEYIMCIGTLLLRVKLVSWKFGHAFQTANTPDGNFSLPSLKSSFTFSGNF